MTFSQGASAIIIYLLLHHHWCPKDALFLQAWFKKISATHKVSYFTTIPNNAKPLPADQ